MFGNVHMCSYMSFPVTSINAIPRQMRQSLIQPIFGNVTITLLLQSTWTSSDQMDQASQLHYDPSLSSVNSSADMSSSPGAFLFMRLSMVLETSALVMQSLLTSHYIVFGSFSKWKSEIVLVD